MLGLPRESGCQYELMVVSDLDAYVCVFVCVCVCVSMRRGNQSANPTDPDSLRVTEDKMSEQLSLTPRAKPSSRR